MEGDNQSHPRSSVFNSLVAFFQRPAVEFCGGGAVLLIAIFIAYLPAIHGSQVWDDDYMLISNPVMNGPHGLWRILFDLSAVPVYYPLTLATLWVERQFFGLQNLTGYHVFNTLLHAVNAIVLWQLLRYLKVTGAYPIAAVWGLHPLCAESVGWITEHKNTLSGFFYLISIASLLRSFGVSEISGPAIDRHRTFCYVSAIAAFVLALAAKTTAVTLPAAALLLVWWKTNRITRGQFLAVIPFAIIALICGSLTQYVEVHITGTWNPDWSITPLQKILVAGRAICFYAGKIVWPTQLSFTYPRWVVNPAVVWQWFFPLVVIGVIALLWRLRIRIGRGSLVGVLFFCGTLAPALGFFHVLYQRYSFVADHFQYLAGVGLIAALVGLTARVPVPRSVGFIATALLVILLTLLTRQSAARFQSNDAVWSSVLALDPQNPLANLNFASGLVAKNEFDPAMDHLRLASSSKILLPGVWIQLGKIAEARRDYVRAADCYGRSVELAPAERWAHFQFGTMLLVLGRLPEAKEQLRLTIQYDPDNAEAHDNLGVCLLHLGQPKEAAAQFQIAQSLKPELPLLRRHLQEAGE